MNTYWIYFIIAFFLLDIVFVLLILWQRSRRKTFKFEELNYIRSHWIRIIDMFSMNPKQSVLDLDKLLDYALSRKGFNGTVADKLKKAKSRFSNLDGVWFAHKLRNQIAHELNDINLLEAKKALAEFKRALNDLGAKL